jgi:predicted MFS family arabinose efflux permease
MILIICCLYSFLANSALTGPAPYLVLFAQIFGVSQSEASNLISYPNLAFGFGISRKQYLLIYVANSPIGSLILVPLYLKIGRRPVILGTMIGVRLSNKLDFFTH